MFESLLARLAHALDAAGLPYMVFGGQAVLLHGEPHLHFQVLSVSGSGRGTPVNPYDLFRRAEMAVAR